MVKIIYQMKKRFISNLQNTFSLKANFRCETAVRHIKMEQFFGKLENHQKNRDNIQTTSTIFNMIKVVNLEAPQTHDVISMSIRRRIDVETTSCVYRETLGVNIYSFNSKLYKFLSFLFCDKCQASETILASFNMVWRRNIFSSSIEEQDTKKPSGKGFMTCILSNCTLQLFFRSKLCKFEIRLKLEKKNSNISRKTLKDQKL